jgi:L-ribulose-5-phosphate 3-epimerase
LNTIGVCSWSLEPTDCEQLAISVTRCGLSHVQLALGPLTERKWCLDATKNILEDSNIRICSGMMSTVGEDYSTLESIKLTGGLRPDEHWETNQARAKASAKIANELGIKLVTFHAGFIPEPEDPGHAVIVDRIARIGDIFGAYDIQIGLETGQERAETLMELLSRPSLAHVGINFDPANMILYGIDAPTSSIELLKNRIVQVHLKDAIQTHNPGTWGTEVPVGDGAVDWAHFFEIVRSLPGDIDVVIERESGTQRVEDSTKACQLAQSMGCTA